MHHRYHLVVGIQFLQSERIKLVKLHHFTANLLVDMTDINKTYHNRNHCGDEQQ